MINKRIDNTKQTNHGTQKQNMVTQNDKKQTQHKNNIITSNKTDKIIYNTKQPKHALPQHTYRNTKTNKRYNNNI